MKSLKNYVLWFGGGAVLLALAIAPLKWPGLFSQPLSIGPTAMQAVRIGLILLPALAGFTMFRSYSATRREKLALLALVLLAAGLCEQVHHQFVDKGHYFGGAENNTAWQRQLQNGVMRLEAGQIPHSYRFLSHSIVAWFEWLGGSFELARGVYRMLFNTLLFAAILRYARLYVTTPAAVAAVLLVVMIYPITIAWYAGQFVDPISHLSFIACLYFFAIGFEPGIAPSLILGVLAKESVAALSVCRAFYGPNRLKAVALAAIYFAIALAPLVIIRYVVNNHSFGYGRISGVEMNHILANLRGYREWTWQYLFTLGILLPGAWLGWRLMDRRFQWTCVVLTAALIVSSAFFSWLNEARNLVPAVVMLVIINVKYFETVLVQRARCGTPADAAKLACDTH